MAVNDKESKWHYVTSWIPQGSIIGLLLFLLYINDLPELTKSDTFLFAYDIKIFRTIIDQNDQGILQHDLNALEQWSNKWLLKFHPSKCKHDYWKKERREFKYSMTSTPYIYSTQLKTKMT